MSLTANQSLLAIASLITLFMVTAQAEEARSNYFNDPFLNVTSAIKDCPVPAGPVLTEAQARAEAHSRIERGTSCYHSGQCRLPNSYLYDQEIIPRAKRAIEADGRFAETSIWIEGQRRFVTLKGCVQTSGQAKELEKLVRRLDDVEGVVNLLNYK
ncbi:BON domain-containing protein [Undibacterium pigrum]|uniref:BON domain-containing protein n=1 Tax=Undibacterium pigrum TaxID=401470 RepID=A0A318IZ68_9BURK|nr:BON domain-containing protein [Undibacterium pigrum]PXX39681.1 BON domain-containing protein [Undibacterium pigrum]